MEKIKISEILSATNGTLITGNTNQEISNVCCDTRNMIPDSLFIPIEGENYDGHDYIEEALSSGAIVSFVDKVYDYQKIKGSLIAVDNTVDAMQKLAAYYRKKFKIPVIGVTGSVGKTTTKEMIASSLGSTMRVLKSEGNKNGQIGLPLAIFNLDKSYEVAIFEMGVSKFGEMDKLCEMADPDIAVVTNIGVSHIENFKSVENTCSEKLKILRKSDGILYLNGDSPILSQYGKITDKKVVYFGINGDYPYKCEEIYSNDNETHFTLSTPKFKDNISIPCLGMHNIYNALAAISIALDMNIHLDDIKKGLSMFRNVGMRQQISSINGVNIIDDSYNASPDSMKSAINVLKTLDGARSVVVMGDMLELGNISAKSHFDIGRYMAIEGINELICVGRYSQDTINGANSVNQNISTHECKNNDDTFEILKGLVKSNDKILFKGSRSMHIDEIAKNLKEYISENGKNTM